MNILSKVESEGQKGSEIGSFYYVPLHEIFSIPIANLLLPYKHISEVDNVFKLAKMLHVNFAYVLNSNEVMAEEMLKFRDRISQTTITLNSVAKPLREYVEIHLNKSS